ncbi:MAG: PilT/PilU family type 4a pilus ATPase [Candidatus Paceibacterota bacterium]
MEQSSLLKELLEIAIDAGASDLHITPDNYPALRVAGNLIFLKKTRKISEEEASDFAFELMGKERKEAFLRDRQIDFSYDFKKNARFRVNAFFQERTVACTLRLISSKVPTIEQLKLPKILHDFIRHPQGFILVTGPSSQGKSTTLASMLNEISTTRSEHIITIEDPIEYTLEENGSIINQREVGRDAVGFKEALKASFRQDPDVIMIGEMRDNETMATAITAAETGHLVFATLHTNSAFQTIHRIVDSFPSDQQNQIRAQLSGSLIAVISQRLVPCLKGGLIPVCEIMINTPATANLIRENKIHEIPLVIETSMESGMISQNRSLANLIKAKEIDLDVALNYSQNPNELRSMLS